MPVRTTDEMPDPPSRPTLALIASEAGVSPATVSKVLNGRTDVAAATRERVEALLRTHNYPGPGGTRRTDDPAKRGLRRRCDNPLDRWSRLPGRK